MEREVNNSEIKNWDKDKGGRKNWVKWFSTTMLEASRLTKTPEGGVILDPYGGVGSTGIAAIYEGRDCIIIEEDPENCKIANLRIEYAINKKEL